MGSEMCIRDRDGFVARVHAIVEPSLRVDAVDAEHFDLACLNVRPVSYTHLTLPTSDLV